MSAQLIRPIRHVFMSADTEGGVWTYALELARGLTKEDIEVTLCVLGRSPSAEQQLQAAAIPSLDLIQSKHHLDWTAREPRQIDESAEFLKSRAIASCADIVHLNAPAHAGRHEWSLPLLVTAHSCVATWWRAVCEESLPQDLAWRRHFTERGLAIADQIITPSKSFAAEIVREYQGASPIDVIYNGRVTRTARATLRKDILTAGRLWDRAKNIGLIDKAASMSGLCVKAAGPTKGPNGEYAELPNVQLIGNLDEASLSDAYAKAKIFVSTPFYEPFGLSVLEAAQHGCALVLSDIPTLRELWGEAALFVPTTHPSDLATALSALETNDRLRQDYAERAVQMSRRYSVDRMTRATLRAYYAALQSRHHKHSRAMAT